MVGLIHHLFSIYFIFSSIRKAICSLLGIFHPRSSLENLCLSWRRKIFSKSLQPIILMLYSAFIWVYQNERNQRIFLNKSLSIHPTAMKGLILFNKWSIPCSHKLLPTFEKIWDHVRYLPRTLKIVRAHV